MAAGGNFFYPIIGLATFATVLAFPFLLLALSPGLISKMPRSGDWMNAVKVVGGLVEIGAALKFINTAELAFVVPENAWFDAHVILTCWIALSRGLRALPPGHLPHRPRSRRRQGRHRPDHLRRGVPRSGHLHGTGPFRPSAHRASSGIGSSSEFSRLIPPSSAGPALVAGAGGEGARVREPCREGHID